MKRSSETDKYAEFVDHPRYGRRPHYTGCNPDPLDHSVELLSNTTTFEEIVARYESLIGKRWPHGDFSGYSNRARRVPNTAIEADGSCQTSATIPVTHYFDLERECRDCSRPFLFFAQEQKHWYEELGFGLDSDCVRCVECRKDQQTIARLRREYETLFHIPNRTEDETLTMAEACVELVEREVFGVGKLETVRMLLNSIPDDATTRRQLRFVNLVDRVSAIQRRYDQEHRHSGNG